MLDFILIQICLIVFLKAISALLVIAQIIYYKKTSRLLVYSRGLQLQTLSTIHETTNQKPFIQAIATSLVYVFACIGIILYELHMEHHSIIKFMGLSMLLITSFYLIYFIKSVWANKNSSQETREAVRDSWHPPK